MIATVFEGFAGKKLRIFLNPTKNESRFTWVYKILYCRVGAMTCPYEGLRVDRLLVYVIMR